MVWIGKKSIFILSTWTFLLIGGVVYDMLQMIFNQINISTEIVIRDFFFFLVFFLPVASIIIIVNIILKYRQITLALYYDIWIDKFYRLINKRDLTKKGFRNKFARYINEKYFNQNGENPKRDILILESFPQNIKNRLQDQSIKDYPTFVQQLSLGNRPVVVRREDLLEKSFLKKWAFVAVLYFKPIKIIKLPDYKSRLIIDLRNESYGIYNNAGKLFLKMYYLTNEKAVSKLLNESSKLESFVKSDKLGEEEFHFHIPFRWASGGIMPIAQYKEKEWFVLFLRELDPVGLNIANGASETKAEYKDLYKLMYREFGEEVVLLDREPFENSTMEINQKMFRYEIEIEEDKKFIKNEKFAEEHQQMRREHDGININFIEGPKVRRIETPFEVKITYHDENLKSKNPLIENVIFNINPTEFGIEISYVAKFEMDDNDYILDGEIWNGELLVRQPVMLISCDFIKKIYQENKSIGTVCLSDDCKDCRVLDQIPSSEYVLFNADLNFRKRRLEKLKKEGSGENTEAQKIIRWLERHESMFANIDESTDLNSIDHPYLTRFCPVTWKIFEQLCYYKLI